MNPLQGGVNVAGHRVPLPVVLGLAAAAGLFLVMRHRGSVSTAAAPPIAQAPDLSGALNALGQTLSSSQQAEQQALGQLAQQQQTAIGGLQAQLLTLLGGSTSGSGGTGTIGGSGGGVSNGQPGAGTAPLPGGAPASPFTDFIRSSFGSGSETKGVPIRSSPEPDASVIGWAPFGESISFAGGPVAGGEVFGFKDWFRLPSGGFVSGFDVDRLGFGDPGWFAFHPTGAPSPLTGPLPPVHSPPVDFALRLGSGQPGHAPVEMMGANQPGMQTSPVRIPPAHGISGH